MPVLAGPIDPDFIEQPIKGNTGTELDAIAIAVTFGRRRSRLYQQTNKGGHVPNSRLTHLPVLAGVLDPDFTKRRINGRVPNSTHPKFPVLAGVVVTDFIKKHQAAPCTEIEANAISSKSGSRMPRFYQKPNKGAARTELEEKRSPVLPGFVDPDFTKNT